MRICIDINGLSTNFSGMSYYLKSFISELDKQINSKYYLFSCYRGKRKNIDLNLDNAERIHIPVSNLIYNILEYRFNLGLTEWFLKKYNLTVYHGSANYCPEFKKLKSVLTLQHYYPLKGEYMGKINLVKSIFTTMVDKSILYSDKIIVSSNFTKNVVIENFKNISDKINVIYLGEPDKVYKKLDKMPPNVEINGNKVPESFILFVGPINRRKNLINLIDAFYRISKRFKDIYLVVTGGYEEEYMKIVENKISDYSIKNKILFLGYVSINDLCLLYNKALILVYPSFYEGFGYPPLEAMACGCPVVASNLTSIPEICGDAALYFDPHSVDEIYDAILKVMLDSEVKNKIVENGYKQVKKYSWEKYVSEVIDIYKRLS